MRKSLWILLCATLTLALSASLHLAFSGAAGAQSPAGPTISEPVAPHSSPAIGDLPSVQTAQIGSSHSNQINPRLQLGLGPSPMVETQVDPVVQAQANNETTTTPPPLLSFDGVIGLGIGASWTPPDVSGDVGPDHYVQMVNSHLAIFDKQGNRLAGFTPINALWRGADNPCGRNNDGDPIVLYDQLADRWLLSQFAHSEGPPYYECIAISQTPDPTGAYYLYAFNVGKDFPDYPKLGVWPSAYFMTTNSTSFGAFAFDRQQMLQGQPGVFQRFNAFDNFMLPADLDGPTPPPAGAPNYFYTINGNNQIKMWAYTVDFANPANSSFTELPALAAAPYNYTTGDLVPRRGTDQRLDSIAEWPMWRFVYRNFGSHETLIGNFSVDGDGNGQIGIRWFELRKVGNGPWQIFQEGTYAPDADHRWMGSVAMDGAGNMALGYTVSGPNLFPSVRYATRSLGDTPGTLQAEQSLVEGGASQPDSNRWGDYSSMSIDPMDDATFWYTTEYYAAGDNSWRTRIGSFRVAAVGAPVLAITKTLAADNTPVRRGDAITYTIEVRNQGTATAENVRVIDNLPEHVAGPDLDQTVTISAGQASILQIKAVLSDTAPNNATIVNTVSFSHTSGAGQSSAAFQVEGGAGPVLAIAKTVATASTPVRRGDAITYTIEIRNQSGPIAENVRVIDNLPEHVAGPDLDQTVTISAGQAFTRKIQAVLSDTAPYEATIVNTSSFSHTSGTGQSSASFQVAPAPPGTLPNLVSGVALTPAVPLANQNVLVTVWVTNTGKSTAENFYVDFYVNPTRAPVTATDWIELAGDEIVQGIEWEIASLAAGQRITLTSDGSNGGVAPDPTFTLWDGYLPAGTQNLYSYADSFNYGDPSGIVKESNEQDNSAYLALSPLTPTLEIELDAPDTVLFDEDIVYTLTVRNRSELPLTDVVVTDRIPAGTEFFDADNGGSEQNGVVTWQIAQLDPGQSISLHMVLYALDYYSLSPVQVPATVRPSVLGGMTSTVGAWPWQAAIIDATAPDEYTGQYCGGTLIELDWVLTAGSCVAGYSPSEVAVVLGRNVLSSSEGQRFEVAEIVLHPDYDVIQKGNAKDAVFIDLNDVALLRLAASPTLNERISPVALVAPAQASAVISGTSAVVTGWGNRSGANSGSDFPDALHEVTLPIVSNEACQLAYGDRFTVTDGMLCAGVPEGGLDSCAGDEGGPLVIQDGNGGWLQAGITSFKYGRGCGKENQYGVYTRVSPYTPWVETAMNTVTNDDYRVITAQGFRATGEFILETRVVQTEENVLYLPLLSH